MGEKEIHFANFISTCVFVKQKQGKNNFTIILCCGFLQLQVQEQPFSVETYAPLGCPLKQPNTENLNYIIYGYLYVLYLSLMENPSGT